MASKASPRRSPPLSEIILNTVRSLVVGLDIEGRVKLFNDRCVEVTGWPREEALGTSWLDTFVPPSARDRVLAIFHDLLEGQGPIIQETPIVTRAADERLIEWRNAVVRDEHGHIVLVVGTGLDITEARQRELQDALLRDLNARLLAGEGLPHVIAGALDALAALSGFELLAVERYLPDSNEMLFMSVHAPADTPALEGLRVPLEQTPSGGVVQSGNALQVSEPHPRAEYRHPTLRGLGIQSLQCYPITADDTVIGTLSLASQTPRPLAPWLRTYLPRVADALALAITRVEAINHLRESERYVRAVLDTAADAILTIDEQGIVQSFNPAATRIFGYQQSEVVGRDVTILMPEAQAVDHDEFLRRHSNTGQAHVIGIGREVVGRRQDGGEFPLELTVSETQLPTGRRLFTGIVRDLTERKQLEAQLRQAQKMEAVGQLAGGVAHDFNNVLTGITGYTQLALRRMAENDPMRHYIEEIQSAAFRATNLSRQLLTFSRQQVVTPRVFDLRALVADVSRLLRRLIGEDIELTVTSAVEAAHVKADPGQIEQVIVNLAVNARDAMPDGGRLRIEIAPPEPSERSHLEIRLRPGPYIAINVSDTGTGMSKEVRSHIFEPFFTTKEPGRGTGLGLATVYGIVTQCGGHIHVHSEPGQGATFRIYLPLVDGQESAAGRGDPASSATPGTETVLLVEDDDIVREVNAEQLRLEGYRVLTARNGDEALELTRSHAGGIDILVTDVIMPRVNGRELAAILTRAYPRVKVLFVSADPRSTALPPDQAPASALFLQKPFRPGELARKVRQAIDPRG